MFAVLHHCNSIRRQQQERDMPARGDGLARTEQDLEGSLRTLQSLHQAQTSPRQITMRAALLATSYCSRVRESKFASNFCCAPHIALVVLHVRAVDKGTYVCACLC